VEAFRAARARRERRRTACRGRGPRSARALAGGLVALFAFGGVAVAVGTGALPGPFRGGAGHAGPQIRLNTPAPAGPAATAARPPVPGATRDPRATTPPRRTATAAPPRTAAPARGPRALCAAYRRAVSRAGEPDQDVLRALRRAAERRHRGIAAYCRAVLRAPARRSESPPSTPSSASQPSAEPHSSPPPS
jgi:hypothetical protein